MKREHNITMLRKELHAAVDEETRFEGKQKDVRKQLLDKVRNITAENKTYKVALFESTFIFDWIFLLQRLKFVKLLQWNCLFCACLFIYFVRACLFCTILVLCNKRTPFFPFRIHIQKFQIPVISGVFEIYKT